MEHNLGLTCDPVGGQVQIPCIERNVIAAMYETGKDMDAKYRETSCGGLARQIIAEIKVAPSQAVRWIDDAAA